MIVLVSSKEHWRMGTSLPLNICIVSELFYFVKKNLLVSVLDYVSSRGGRAMYVFYTNQVTATMRNQF